MIGLPQDLSDQLAAQPRHWLVTGSAGFIGSHLLETLLRAGQQVTSLDNFSTGHRHNLEQVREAVGDAAWQRHRFIEGDIADLATSQEACKGVNVVLHQAALGSVPRSIADPLNTHRSNATGFLTMLTAARDAGVSRFVYAASSSTYGDSPSLPKVEDVIGNPLSPYAVTKYLNELYAQVFQRCYGFETVGLRYFNVFGPRQDPNGAYAAVIPRWVAAMLRGEVCQINGDGQTSRDFCYIANTVQANLRAALVPYKAELAQIYNVAVGDRTTLTDLHTLIADMLVKEQAVASVAPPNFAPFRAGDVRHSLADIGKARTHLGYAPTHDVEAGMAEAVRWYIANSR
ncbi:MAG: SDR family oxidoreductase [Aquabacterium sp.]